MRIYHLFSKRKRKTSHSAGQSVLNHLLVNEPKHLAANDSKRRRENENKWYLIK